MALIVVGAWGSGSASRAGSCTHGTRTSGASFAMGTLHGLAGSSHLFGVLPALAFSTRADSMLYLAGFGARRHRGHVGVRRRRWDCCPSSSAVAAFSTRLLYAVFGGRARRSAASGCVGPVTAASPALLAAFVVMLAGFWLADVIGQQILAAQGLTGSSPLSGVPVAIVLGLLLRNTLPLPASLTPGLKFATTTILRAGIVLVGIRLSVFDVVKLGIAGLPVVLAAIATGLLFVTWFNRKLGLPPRLGTLIAAGTSICGVTAIVSTAPAIDADEREVAYAVANVVAFGLFGMLAYPYLAHALLGIVGDDRLVPRHRRARHLAGGRRRADLQAGLRRRRRAARGDGDEADAQHFPGRR